MPKQRHESVLSDDAAVVRGGLLLPDDLRKSLLLAVATTERPGLSVWGAEGASVGDILQQVHVFKNYNSYRASTAGALRRAGFELEKTRAHPLHFTVWLPSESDYEIQRFVGCFGPIRRNQFRVRLNRGRR